MTAPYGPGDPQQPGPGRQYPQYSQYSQYSQHPQQPPGYGPPPTEPSSVRTAFGLWIAALALYLVGQLLAVLFPPTAEDYAAYFSSLGLPADPQLLQTVESTSGITSIVGFVVTLVFVALFAWFGLKVRAGATWARITTAILAGLGILGALGTGAASLVSALPVAAGGVGTILQVLAGLLLIGYLVFLFQRPSNEYFAAHAARR